MGDGRLPSQIQSPNRKTDHVAGIWLHLWHHCQQLGDLLRVAGGIGGDAATETVYGRAKPVQLLVVDDGLFFIIREKKRLKPS